MDEALAAVLAGDLPRAQLLLSRATLEAESPQGRALIGLLADRLKELGQREAPAVAAPGAEAGPAVAASLTTQAPSPAARAMLLVTTTGLGLGFWGRLVPGAFDISSSSSSRGFLGLYMLTAASSFAVPFFWTRSHPPNFGQANLAFYGGTRGLLYGFLGSWLAQGDAGSGGTSDAAEAVTMLAGSLGGLIGGSMWASEAGMSPGHARTVAVMGDLGLGLGLLGGLVIGGEDLGEGDDRLPAGMGLAGAALGVTAGRFLSLRQDNTWGDGEVMRAGGLYGALLGATVGVTADLDEGHWRAMLITVMAGTTLGHLGGHELVRSTDFSVAGAILVDLALISGALAGVGIFHLIDGGEHENGYLLSASGGGGVAAGLAYYSLRDWGQDSRAAGARPQVALVPLLPLGPMASAQPRGVGVAGSF